MPFCREETSFYTQQDMTGSGKIVRLFFMSVIKVVRVHILLHFQEIPLIIIIVITQLRVPARFGGNPGASKIFKIL